MSSMKDLGRSLRDCLIVYAIAVFFLFILGNLGILLQVTLLFQDRFQWLFPPSLHEDLVVVDIDQQSVDLLTSKDIVVREDDMPMRETLAEVIRNLNDLGAKVIAIDLLLHRLDSTDGQSGIFETASLENVIHSINFLSVSRNPKDMPSDSLLQKFSFSYAGILDYETWLKASQPERTLPGLERTATNLGHIVLIEDDADWKVRRLPVLLNYSIEQTFIPSLSIAALSKYYDAQPIMSSRDIHFKTSSGESRHLPFNNDGLAQISFLRSLKRSQKLSYSKLIIPGSIEPERIQDKLVLIGATAGQGDLHDTPIADQYPGLYVHASMINSVLQGKVLRVNGWLAPFLLVLIGFPFYFLVHRIEYRRLPKTGALMTVSAVGGVILLALITFLMGWLWDIAVPVFGIASIFNIILVEGKIKNQRYKAAFRREIESYQIQVQDLEWELLNQSALLSRPKFIDSHILYSLENNITRTSKLLENRSQDLHRLVAQYGTQGSASISDDLTSEQGKLDKHSSTVSELTDKLEFVRENIKEEKKEMGFLMAEDSKDPSEIKTSIEAISKTLDDLEEKWQHGMMDNGQYFRMKVFYEKQKASLVDRLEKLGVDEKEVDLDPTHKIFNEILIELRGMRGDLGSHFEAVLYRLDKNEQKEVQKMIGKADSLTDASEYLEPIRDSLIELSSAAKTQLERDKEVSVSLQQVIAKLQSKDDDKVSASAKLKYSLPIIPAILKLEGELDFGSSKKLREIWDKLADNYNKLKNKLLDA